MKTKTFTVEIRVTVSEDADVELVVQEMDYKLDHPAIIDTEITDYTT